MGSTGAIHPAILVASAALLFVLSAAIVFLRRKRAASRPWQALSKFGQALRRRVDQQPKLSAFCAAAGKRRWHLVCLSLIAITAAAWMFFNRAADPEMEVAVVELVATDDAGAAAAEGSFAVEIDSRQLARQDADARRIQQGLILLAAIGVIALFWATASRFAAAR